jgi:hypothetical protein
VRVEFLLNQHAECAVVHWELSGVFGEARQIHRGLGVRRVSHKGRGAGEKEFAARAYESQGGPSSISPLLLVHLNLSRRRRSLTTISVSQGVRSRHPSDAATQTHPVNGHRNQNVVVNIRSAFRVSGAMSSFVAVQSLGSAPGAKWHPTCLWTLPGHRQCNLRRSSTSRTRQM